MQIFTPLLFKKIQKVSRLADVGLVLLALFSLALKPSFAYLDPGTGSYIFQMAIAGLFAGAFAVKQFWSQIKVFIDTRILHKADKKS